MIAAIKSEGMSITDAAKTYLVTEKTIRRWLRKQTQNAHTSSTEVQRLKQENQVLKEIIGDIALQHKLKRKSALFSS